MTHEAETRCHVCNSEAIIGNRTRGQNYLVVECGSCTAVYNVHLKTGTISYEPQAQRAVRIWNGQLKRDREKLAFLRTGSTLSVQRS